MRRATSAAARPSYDYLVVGAGASGMAFLDTLLRPYVQGAHANPGSGSGSGTGSTDDAAAAAAAAAARRPPQERGRAHALHVV